MTAPEGRKADPHAVFKLKDWRKREDDILAGAVIPSLQDRYNGHSAFKCSALLDVRQVVDLEVERDRLPPHLLAALRELAIVPTGARCWATSELVADADQDLGAVLLWHAAIRGHERGMQELLHDTLFDRRPHDRMGWSHMCALVLGLQVLAVRLKLDDKGTEAVDVALAVAEGLGRLRTFGSLAGERDAASDAMDLDQKAIDSGMVGALAAMKAAQATDLNSVEDMLLDVEEDRAEIVRSKTLLAVPFDPALKVTGARADAYKGMKGVLGSELPLVDTSRLASARTTLHARYPYMTTELDVILATQSALPFVRLNVLLVSDPGMGKTTVARDLGEALGLPQITYGCGGANDSAFGGTSAQWTNVRCSVPLQLIGRSKTANPLVILDEIDKIGTSKHNGSLADVLLGFLERSSSRAYHDIALEQDVDLSAVSYVATANNLDDVPAPLRDRFKVVRIPAPGWQHIGVLSERIIDGLAEDRNLDRRWFEPLAEDEIDIVKKAWPGGSIRRLQWIVARLVDGREQLMGRA